MDWEAVRSQFRLDPEWVHLGTSQYFASHPTHVREAIAHHAKELDANPAMYIVKNEQSFAKKARDAAAKYLDMKDPDQIALTDSTTVGLGIIYSALNIREGHEIVSNEHNYYSQQEAIKRASERTGATFRETHYFDDIHTVTQDELVHNIMKEVTDRTRVVGATWVHSNTGLKSPIAKIAKAIAEENRGRDEENRILLVVDGVHGFGIEKESFDELGCDFLAAGCHKWIYGPRGTGIIAAKESAWQHTKPVIPSFSETMWDIIKGGQQPEKVNGTHMSPGGFHSMEHLWALPSAFEWIDSLGGKEVIYDRVHQLNRICKEGLADMSHVDLVTPMDDDMSAGIIAFEIKGMSVHDTVEALVRKKIVSTEAPYLRPYARFTPGIYNTEEDIRKALDAVQSLKH